VPLLLAELSPRGIPRRLPILAVPVPDSVRLPLFAIGRPHIYNAVQIFVSHHCTCFAVRMRELHDAVRENQGRVGWHRAGTDERDDHGKLVRRQ